MTDFEKMYENNWTMGQLFIFRMVFVFAGLFMLSFPFPVYIFPDWTMATAPFFETLTTFVAETFLDKKVIFSLESDTQSLYIHTYILLVIAWAAAIAWTLANWKRDEHKRFFYWLHTLCAYYLAFVLLSYGLNKVFKWQFYLPEPNTLYTTVGNTPPDLLFWSAMGSSYGYTVFSGIIEIIPALLLLFRRTRLAGAVIAFGVLVNVAALNFGFNISVKVFSGFLLLLCGVLIAPYCKTIYSFFIRKQQAENGFYIPMFSGNKYKVYAAFKTAIIIVLFADSFYLYATSGNFNDDTAPRPHLHGAYNVEAFVLNGDTLPPLLTDTVRWRRVFVHRRGYFITQSMNDEMMDYELTYEKGQLRLYNYYHNTTNTMQYRQYADSILVLYGVLYSDTITVTLYPENLNALPAMQPQFHWAVD